MSQPVMQTLDPVNIVLDYHRRTKHRLDRYAAGPETLDWTLQPDPFREFAGSPRIDLPLNAGWITTPFAQLHAAGSPQPQALNLDSIGTLLELSLALSAWKEYGPDRWALRCNPSSGNLHPTEAYVIAQHLPGLAAGVYHYVSRDHALEQRCAADANDIGAGPASVWIGLSSIHWREAWKYGERAFRYCQLDIGHALGALGYAAATLGWSVQWVAACGDARLAHLLGIDRHADFSRAESESPELLLAIIAHPAPDHAQREQAVQRLPALSLTHWQGQANVLDAHPMYRWPVIAAVDSATRAPGQLPDGETSSTPDYPPLTRRGTHTAVEVIRNRRSAQHFDRKFVMPADDFFHLLDALLIRPQSPWDAWRASPHVHPLLFVHRVADVAPGLYALLRDPRSAADLQQALHGEFIWRPVDGAPAHLPLWRLHAGDFRQIAKNLSCHQAIAADSCFSLAMLADFEPLIQAEPWRYRQLYWEAGLLGQVLYLGAEAVGLRGTGIGCYFDDVVHELLGLRDERHQSLYHFTVGRALTDTRISTSPPYPDPLRERRRAHPQENHPP